ARGDAKSAGGATSAQKQLYPPHRFAVDPYRKARRAGGNGQLALGHRETSAGQPGRVTAPGDLDLDGGAGVRGQLGTPGEGGLDVAEAVDVGDARVGDIRYVDLLSASRQWRQRTGMQ